MRQIASQTGDLLRQMRFVASRGAATESHREDVAGRGAAAESHREDVAGRGRCGGMERSGSLNGRACRSAEDAAMQQMHRSSSAGRQKEKASKHRSLAQKKQPGTEACDPNADCARKITIRVNILLTLRPATPRSNKLRSGPPPAKQPHAKWPAAAGRSAT